MLTSRIRAITEQVSLPYFELHAFRQYDHLFSYVDKPADCGDKNKLYLYDGDARIGLAKYLPRQAFANCGTGVSRVGYLKGGEKMHNEYKRIVPNADTAVLFIHGIIGTPNHFADFLPLVPNEVSVHNVLLDGHGKDVTAFSKTSMKKWEAQVTAAVDELAQNHQTIYIAAHSMGCLLAMEQAVRHPKVAKLFLLAVPLKLFLRRQMFVTSLKVYFNKIDPNDVQALAAKRCCGIEHHKNPFRYLGWVPRFAELFGKIRKTRTLLPSLTIPCTAYQSAKDEMVSPRSAQLLQTNPHVAVVVLENSTHYHYDKADLALLTAEFRRWVT